MKALAAHLKDDLADNPDSTLDARGYQPRQLVLWGASMAHLQVLTTLAARPLSEVRVILIATHPRVVYPGRLGEFVAARATAEECTIALEPLVRRAGIRWLQRNVRSINVSAHTLLLDDGTSQHYDWLSINHGPVQNREALEASIPGAREHGLFLYPSEAFVALWPRVCEMAATRALRVAVIGTGTRAVELALAVRLRMPDAAITVVIQTLDALHPPGLLPLVAKVLRRERINVLQDVAVGLKSNEVMLGCGAALACDVPLLAMESAAGGWALPSGLALDAQGAVSTDVYQRSTSHPNVFVSHQDSAVLAKNIATATAHAQTGPFPALLPMQDTKNNLHHLFGGTRGDFATWRNYCTHGWAANMLKKWTDNRLVARYAQS